MACRALGTLQQGAEAVVAGRWNSGLEGVLEQVDFGTYPFVTSSNPSIGGVASGLGLAPTKFGAIIGVVRSPDGRGICIRFLPPSLFAEVPTVRLLSFEAPTASCGSTPACKCSADCSLCSRQHSRQALRALPLLPDQAKAYTTRVGAGPYPTEISGVLGEHIRSVGAEYGTTTGRPRRVGWLDIPALRYATRWVPDEAAAVGISPACMGCIHKACCCPALSVLYDMHAREAWQMHAYMHARG